MIGRDRGFNPPGDSPEDPPGGEFVPGDAVQESVTYDTPRTPDQVIAMFVKRMVRAVEKGEKKQFLFGWTDNAEHTGESTLIANGLERPEDIMSAMLTLFQVLQRQFHIKPVGLAQRLIQEIIKRGGML